MREEPLRARQPPVRRVADSQLAVQESSWSARIDHEPGSDSNRPAFPLTVDDRGITLVAYPREPRHVEIGRTFSLRLVRQRLIELRAVPVRVGNGVVRARRDHQLTVALVVVGEQHAWLVEEEREAALQTARDVRTLPLPCAPLGERAKPREIVPIGEFFDQQVGERRRGFTDGEARVTATLDQDHASPALEQRERRQRPGEARSDDHDVGVDPVNRSERHQ
jgi:hypothetical protein